MTNNDLRKDEVIGLYDFRRKKNFPFEEKTPYKFQIVDLYYDAIRHNLKVVYLLTDMDDIYCVDVLNEYDTTSYDFTKLIKVLYPVNIMVIELTRKDFLRTSGVCKIKYINNYPVVDISTIRKDEPHYETTS